MGALSHFIEREGIATTSISLIREHTEYMNPPRALWVPFYLGRPLGVPGDSDFQRDVLRATLNLLPTLSEHGIVDYPIEAPEDSFSHTWACPVAFESGDADNLSGRLRAEVLGLAPWWREMYRARGRTSVGSCATLAAASDGDTGVPQRALTLASFLSAIADGAAVDAIPSLAHSDSADPGEALDDVHWTHPMPFLLRHIVQDLRCYYQEAIASQPGAVSLGSPSHRALNDWIFKQTALGEVIIEVGRRLTETEDPRLRILRGWTVPEGYWPDGPTWGVRPTPSGENASGASDASGLSIADEANALLSGQT